MAKSKQQKPRVPRRVAIPGIPNKRDGWMAEGDVHAALLALESGRFMLTHLSGLIVHASLALRLCPNGPPYIRASVTALISFCTQLKRQVPASAEAEFLLGVSPEVELGIRRCVRDTLPWLRKQPDALFLRAALAAIITLDKSRNIV